MAALLVLLLNVAPAHAITEDSSGPYVEVSAGLGLSEKPLTASPGWAGSAGWWFGPYDKAYSIGRFTGVGATVRQDLSSAGLRTVPMLEVRRGLDLIVANAHGFLGGGPVLLANSRHPPGIAARAGFGARFRFHRFWGVGLRLEAGADVTGGQVAGAGAALLSLAWTRPNRPVE